MSEYTIIFVAIDILFLVFFSLGVLGGFIRGTFRQSIRAIITIGLVLAGFIIASPVTKKFLQLNISLPNFDEDISVIENIYKIVADKLFQGDMNKMITTGVSEVVYDVTFSVLRLTISVLLGLVSLFVFAPIIKLIVLGILNAIRKKKPRFLGRIGGMVVAAVEFICLFCIFILPLYGALEVATKTIHEVAPLNEEVATADKKLAELTTKSYIYRFTSNFGKTKKSSFGIGGKCFGSYISIKTEKGKVNYIKDLDNILPFVNRAIIINQEMRKTDSINEKLDVITEDDLERLLYVLEKSDIVEYVYPLVIKYMETYSTEKEMLIALNLDYDVLVAIDFNNDIANSSDLIKTLYKLAQSIDLDKKDDFDQYLNDDEIVTMISEVFVSAMKIELFRECFPKIAYYAINKSMEENKYSELVKLITVEYLKNDFANDLEVLANVYQTAKETDIIDYFKKVEKEYTLTDEMEAKLIEAAKKISEIKLFQNNYPTLIKQVGPYVKDVLPLDIEQMVLEDVDWDKEVKILLEVLVYGYELMINGNFEDGKALLENPNSSTCLKKIVTTLSDSSLAEKYYYPALIEFMNKSLTDEFMKDYTDLITVQYLQNGFAEDIDDLFDIYNIGNELHLFELFGKNNSVELDLTNEETRQKVENILTKIINLKLFVGHENDLFKTVYKSARLEKYAEYKELVDNINWKEEKILIVEVAMDILNLGKAVENFDTDLSDLEDSKVVIDKIANLFDKMYLSQVARPYVFELLDVIIKNSGFNFTFTNEEKQNIVNNTMVKEMDILFEVIKEAKNIFGSDAINGNIDIDNLNGDSIATLMKKASESYIASKIIGQLLNDTLGERGFNINPIDEETGLPRYDFTNPNVLKNEATSVGLLVDLANNSKNLQNNVASKGEITDEQIETITKIVGDFANHEGSTEIIEDVINNLCEKNNITIDENTDWQNEASIITDVLTDYQSSTDKENYNLDDNEELKTLVENSEIASGILSYLGILD